MGVWYAIASLIPLSLKSYISPSSSDVHVSNNASIRRWYETHDLEWIIVLILHRVFYHNHSCFHGVGCAGFVVADRSSCCICCMTCPSPFKFITHFLSFLKAVCCFGFAWLSDKTRKRALLIAFQTLLTIIGLLTTAYAKQHGVRYFGTN